MPESSSHILCHLQPPPHHCEPVLAADRSVCSALAGFCDTGPTSCRQQNLGMPAGFPEDGGIPLLDLRWPAKCNAFRSLAKGECMQWKGVLYNGFYVCAMALCYRKVVSRQPFYKCLHKDLIAKLNSEGGKFSLAFTCLRGIQNIADGKSWRHYPLPCFLRFSRASAPCECHCFC